MCMDFRRSPNLCGGIIAVLRHDCAGSSMESGNPRINCGLCCCIPVGIETNHLPRCAGQLILLAGNIPGIALFPLFALGAA